MQTRPVTIFALLQMGVLVAGILLTRAFLKVSKVVWEQRGEMVEPARLFATYGILFTLPIIAWVYWASKSLTTQSSLQNPELWTKVSGLALLATIAYLGVRNSISAFIILF